MEAAGPPSSKRTKAIGDEEEGEGYGLSAYEQERLRQISANRAVLQRMMVDVAPPPAQLPRRTTRTSRVRREPEVSPFFTGYRLRNHAKSEEEEEEEEDVVVAEPQSSTPPMDDAKVYSCRASMSFKRKREGVEEEEEDFAVSPLPDVFTRPEQRKLSGFEATGHVLQDEALSRVYSMSFGGAPGHRMLAAGGHQGRVAIFPLEGRKAITAASHSWRAHSGWISSVQVIADMLLTSSNDHAVVLWRLAELPEAASVLRLDSGVFMADERVGSIVCALKNGTVVLASISEAKLSVVSAFERAHYGVVKAVRLRDDAGCVFASTGNDRALRVHDSRAAKNPQIELLDVHELAVNGIEWNPSSAGNTLATSSFDGTIATIDIRAPAIIHRFRGHSGNSRNKHIHRAIFVDSGSGLCCSGDASTLLSLYDTNAGTTISRGNLGFEATTIEGFGDDTAVLAAAHPSSGITLLQPVYESSPL